MKKDLRKVESAFLLALLLLPGIFIALPAVSVVNVAAYSGPAPASVSGAAASIDYPVFAAISNGAPTSDTRIITISNPAGNTGITTITISVPAGAVSAAPTGTIPTNGGVPDCSSTACNAAVFGSGPYSLQYTDTSTGHAGAVILPGGASISLTITIKPEANTAASGAADTYPFSVSVTDSTGANTVLNAITTYYTKATGVTVAGPSSTTQTAGSTFTFTASLNQTGVPLYVSDNTGDATMSPTSWTSGSSAQTITANDTTAEIDSFKVGGPAPKSGTTGGLLTNGTTASITVNPGAVSQLTVKVSGYSASKVTYINETSATLIPAASVVVYTTDKFGNAAPFSLTSATSVTLSATTLKGQSAGFTNETSYTTPTSYPYTPSDLSPTVTISIAAGASSQASNSKFYFGPDYGSQSQVVAVASGLPTGSSSIIRTWAFQTTAPTMFVTNGLTVKAGSAAPVVAELPFAQAGVTVLFWISTNSSDYGGLFSNGMRSITAVSTANSTMAVAKASLNVDTTLGATAVITANYLATPTSNSSSAATGTISTTYGTFAKLNVKAYFDSAQANKATASVASGTLYVDVTAADAYGNVLTVSSGTVQISLSTTAGSLSTSTAFITATHSGITASGYQVQFKAPASGSATISATGTYSGVSASGSLTISIVSASPTVAFTSVPTNVTSGVPQTIKGWANVSIGVAPTTITKLEYSLNGATNVTVASGSATNQFTLTLLLATTNTLTVYAEDGNGVWTTATVQIPQVSVDHSFTFPSTPASYKFGVYNSVNATITNNTPNSLTAAVFVVVQNSAGQTIEIATGTVTVASGATGSAFPILTGLAAGTYTAQVFVLTTSGVSVSPATTVTVTIS